ncbi:hypothetical protein [Cellulomonas persica]|uniref:Uncharacterized protein n=1 Tax=Cellulomonas persica TaxID=76861 RepID=A0A510UVH2_9CELL|nr:hypothetical protein [Cellulomonas persica]GEK17471.1 hypothetical protein CPE01_12040 [Cellulomonas persica]
MTATPSPARQRAALADLLAHRTLAVAAVLVGAVGGVLTALAATAV